LWGMEMNESGTTKLSKIIASDTIARQVGEE